MRMNGFLRGAVGAYLIYLGYSLVSGYLAGEGGKQMPLPLLLFFSALFVGVGVFVLVTVARDSMRSQDDGGENTIETETENRGVEESPAVSVTDKEIEDSLSKGEPANGEFDQSEEVNVVQESGISEAVPKENDRA